MLIEDYGLVGDLRAAALVGRNGSVDWLCLPRFDSASCFSALLGDERHGRWLVAPADEVLTTTRRYRPDTLVLDTDFETADGAVRVTDFMPPRGDGPPRFMRIVEGLRGRVRMRLELVLRPDYGSITPWTELVPDGVMATAGADAFRLSTPLSLSLDNGTATAEFDAIEGARERFILTWHPAHRETPPVEDADSALARTETWWQDWTGRGRYEGAYRDEVMRSLIVLKAMTYETTGALIAAPTTSLPEDIGGLRNWDYRYCWLRDSVLALQALIAAELRRRSHGLPRLPPAHRDRRPVEAADHVCDRRGAQADGVRAAGTARVRRVPARPGRQRRVRTVPAGCLRRGPERGLPRRPAARPHRAQAVAEMA